MDLLAAEPVVLLCSFVVPLLKLSELLLKVNLGQGLKCIQQLKIQISLNPKGDEGDL